MPRGSGFVHLNTPAAITYSPGQQVSLADLRQGCRREDCVVLPHTVGIWRSAFRSYVREEGLSQFVSDIEAEREGEGPVLPPLRATTAAQKRREPQKTLWPTETVSTTFSAAGNAEDDSVPGKEKGIVIVSHHKVSGEQRFVYPDYDGVLSSGVVPKVVISEEEKAELEADRKYYVSPADLPEEERMALEELQTLWKSRAHSHSEQGAKHRAVVGNIVPDGSALDLGETHHNDTYAKRSRLEPRMRHGPNAAESSELNTGDTLDDALRLAGELLDII